MPTFIDNIERAIQNTVKQLPEIPGIHHADSDGFEEILSRLKTVTSTKSDQALSLSLGLQRGAVGAAKRRGLIPANWILEVVRRFNTSIPWLILGDDSDQVSNDFCLLPIIEPRLTPSRQLDTESSVDFFMFKRSWLENKGNLQDLYLLYAAGKAMEPLIQDKDLVLINTRETEAKSESDIFLVTFNDSLYIRRIAMEPGKIVLRAENSKLVPDVSVDLHERKLINILGRVLWWSHEVR